MEWISTVVVVLGVVAIWISVGQLQARLSRVEQKLNVLLHQFNIDLTQGLGLSDRVKELAADPSRKIEAIKAYRAETGASLADAKLAVETYMNSR